jgi:uncharacterized membrane protein YqjE
VTDEPPPAQKSVAELVSDMTSQVSALFRKELEMARLELKDEMRQAAKAGGMLGGGALSGYFALLFFSLAVAWWFDKRMSRGKAFFLVAMLHGAAAAALLAKGREEIEQVDPVPTETVETLKESGAELAKAIQS